MAVLIPPRVRTVARVVIALVVAVAAIATPTPAVAGVIDLSPTSNVASSPDVVVDQAGNTTAIWVERDPSDAFSAWIAAAYKPAGQPWEERKVLTETANRRVATPRLAVDPAGRVTAVWGWALGDTSGFVQSASRAAGPNQPWTSPVGNISSDDPMEQPAERGLQLVADAQGNLLAAWFQRNTTSTSQFDVMVAERPPGGPWSTATPVAVQATGSPGPEALVAAKGINGHAVIGWSRPVDATTTEVKVIFRAPGDAWSTPHTITLTGTSMLTPLVEGLTAAIDGAGRATLCWEGSLQGIACSDRSGGAWSGSYPVADNASTTPNIAAGPADAMLLAWRGPTDSGGQIRPVVAKTRQGGGAWGAERLVGTLASGLEGPRTAFAASGSALTSWLALGTVQGATLAPGGTLWKGLGDLSGAGGAVLEERVATYPDGRAVVVWIRGGALGAVVQSLGDVPVDEPPPSSPPPGSEGTPPVGGEPPSGGGAQPPAGPPTKPPACGLVAGLTSKSRSGAVVKRGQAWLTGPAGGVLLSGARPSTFTLALSGAARGGLRKAELLLDGKRVKQLSRPRGNGKVAIAPALLAPGRHVLTAVLTPVRGRAKRVSLPFMVGSCPPASLALAVARARAGAVPSLRLTLKSGGPALGKTSFVLPKKLRAQVGRRSAGKSVGTLRLTVGGRARTIALKVPRKARSRGTITLAQGVTLRQGAGPRLDVLPPAGTTAIDLSLTGGQSSLLAATRACPSGAMTARVTGAGGAALSLRTIPVVRCGKG